MKRIARSFSLLLILSVSLAVLPTTTVYADPRGPSVWILDVSPDFITSDDLVTVSGFIEKFDITTYNPIDAQFNVNDSPWMTFVPDDGVWDSISESFSIEWLPVDLGTTTLCIQAYDGALWSDPTCVNFIVYAPQDNTAPTTTGVAASPASPLTGDLVSVSATVDDTGTVITGVASAEFNVNGGAYAAMTASDGEFDEIVEGVTGAFTAATTGVITICVRGEDGWGNVGAAACTDVTVQTGYASTGFLQPVKASGTNTKAGHTFALRFTLTQVSDGSPVTDPAVIAGVMSYDVDCTTLAGNPASAVPEGDLAADLSYLGNGMWLFDWQIPASYSQSCRMVFVALSDGTVSPASLFRLR